MILPILKVSRLEQSTNEAQEASIMDMFSEGCKQDFVRQAIEARFDVAFNEPIYPMPGIGNLPESRMTPPSRSKSVREVAEGRFKVPFKDESNNLLKQFVRPRGHTEWAFLGRDFLLGVDPPGGCPAIPFQAECFDHGIYFPQRHLIHRF